MKRLIIVILIAAAGCSTERELPSVPLPTEKILINDKKLHSYYKATAEYTEVYAKPRDKKKGRPECRIYNDEVELFHDMITFASPEYAIDIFRHKGRGRFSHRTIQTIKALKKKPQVSKGKGTLAGSVIVLDPGHVAGSMKEAIMERKYVWLNHRGMKIRFYEADLNLQTALIVQKKLQRDGATVYLTRHKPGSVTGLTFEEWKNNHMEDDVEKLVANGDIPKNRGRYIVYRAKDIERFRFFLSEIDLPARSAMINRYNPHVAMSIHYNATGDTVRNIKGKVDRVAQVLWDDTLPDSVKVKRIENAVFELPRARGNYSCVYIGGSFDTSDMSLPRKRMHFLRLLISKDIHRSRNAAKYVIREMRKSLKLKVPGEKYASYVHSTNTGIKGVLARHLRLTGQVTVPFCLVEPLIQNFPVESRVLNKRDRREEGYLVSSRVQSASRAYYRALKRYCLENVIKK